MTLPEDRWLITAAPLQRTLPTWHNSSPFEAEFTEPPSWWGITSQAPAMETAMAPLNLLAQLEGPLQPSIHAAYESPLDPFAVASSPGWELVLVVDTALSMQPWFSTANAIAACAHDLPLFHSVRVIRMKNRQDKPLEFVPDASSLSQTLAGTNRRCMILLLTDGVGPHWRLTEVLALLRDWACRHVVAILQTLPHIEWKRTALPTRPVRLRAPVPGCANSDLVVHGTEEPQTPATETTDSAAGTVIPVLELRKRWVDQWVRLLLSTSRVHQHVVILPAGPLEKGFIPNQVEQSGASERVAAFESAVPESTYELAKRLAMAPLNRYVMDLIADKSKPTATPSDLSRILTSNLIVAYETPAGEEGRFGEVTFGFADEVRQCLLAQSDSIATYHTAELLERHLADHMRPLVGLADRLRKPTAEALPAMSPQAAPYLRVEASLLTALSAESPEHRTTAEHLRSKLGSRMLLPEAGPGTAAEPPAPAGRR
ncbi:hypothetical protein AB0D30_36035 [Streptomyces sp. NPDC048409]|uniref:hypothetical protein n=2 Tax=unclassified Streptomyces TaxID=2593676 RepID=UPI0034343FC9